MSTPFSPPQRPNGPNVATDPSPHLPAAPVLDGDTLARLTVGRDAVSIVIGDRDPATLRRVADGYLLKTDRLTVRLDSAGVCTGFTDPTGREVSRRFIGGELLLERLQRWGISEGAKERPTPARLPGQPTFGQVVSSGPPIFNTVITPPLSPEPPVMQIAGIGSHTPHLRNKGVPSPKINAFLGLAQEVFQRHGITLNKAQLAALAGCCLQENALNPTLTVGGLGICQWTADRAQNFRGFFAQYRQQYPQASVVEGQLAYVIHEMRGIGGIRGNGGGSEVARGGRAFLQASSLDDAMKAMKDYLRYGERGNRYAFAREFHGLLTEPEQIVT